MEDIRIGLWGGPGSGKTHYVAMLYKDILARADQGFSIEELPDSDSFPGLSNLIDKYAAGEITTPPMYASDLGDKFITERRWLPRTKDNAEDIKTFRFRIHHPEKSGEGKGSTKTLGSILLTVTDAGGGWYRYPWIALQRHGKEFSSSTSKNPIKLLQECQGIICLFDSAVGIKGKIWAPGSRDPLMGDDDLSQIQPENRPLTRDEIPGAFRDLCRFLKDRNPSSDGKLQQPVALCLSKIDQPGLWERRKDPKALEEWANSHLPGLPDEVRNACKAEFYCWFGVSVLGATENPAGEPVSPTDQKNNILEDVPIRPYNLFDPIAWLASRIKR